MCERPDQGSQANGNGGGGYVRDQGSQGQRGGRVCERPGVSGAKGRAGM